MKIRIAMLDSDRSYLNRIQSVFENRYSENLELYTFTDTEQAISEIVKNRISVLLVSDSIDFDMFLVPTRCTAVYFVESPKVDSINGVQAVCKYQKPDLIYKQIQSIYAEKNDVNVVFRSQNGNAKIIAFQSPCGGCGTSTAAAACALHYAKLGKKTIYLNLEANGIAETYFHGAGQSTLRDVITTMQMGRNLFLKLESYVKQDRGVDYYAQSQAALDMVEFSDEDILSLTELIEKEGNYDVIVLDLDFSLKNSSVAILRMANAIVWVGNGSRECNAKLLRAYESLEILEQKQEFPLMNRMTLIHNRSGGNVELSDAVEVRHILRIPNLSGTTEQVMEQMALMPQFDQILE